MIDEDVDWLHDEHLDAWAAEWERAERHAAAVLREACPDWVWGPAPDDLVVAASVLRAGLESGARPYRWFEAACGWADRLPTDDRALWLDALAATIEPPADPEGDVEGTTAVTLLTHADWVAIALGALWCGPGAELDVEAVERDLVALPELEGEVEELDRLVVAAALSFLSPLWRSLGVLDEAGGVTGLGAWGLARTLHTVWSGEPAPPAGSPPAGFPPAGFPPAGAAAYRAAED